MNQRPPSPGLPFGFGTLPPADESAALHAMQQLALSAERMLGISRAFAEAGRPVDLSGLNLAVGRLTAGTLDLSPDHGRSLIPALQSVLLSLDRLHAVLTASAPSGPHA